MIDLKRILFERGRADALRTQREADTMTGTELYRARERIPAFGAALQVKNMLDRAPGFLCRTRAGRVVRLLQSYDSGAFPQEPEQLPAQWGFVWSKDPADALPFLALASSPYGVGECCTLEGEVYRSLRENNVHSPAEYPEGWEVVR